MSIYCALGPILSVSLGSWGPTFAWFLSHPTSHFFLGSIMDPPLFFLPSGYWSALRLGLGQLPSPAHTESTELHTF